MEAPESLAAWLTYLETLHPKTIDLGLERTREVALRLDLLPFQCPVITVAGTNGKGSCVALLESIFLAAGYRVGTYTSPHLLSYNERVRVNGIMAEDGALCSAFSAVDTARHNTSLTYFEFGTLAALWLFKRARLDLVILEVGMGGRLDAVNIVDADVAIISTIALDHMEWLGNDREAIGFEKAGIMRSGKPVVCGDFATPNSVREYAKQIGAVLYCQGEDFHFESKANHWAYVNECAAGQVLVDLPVPKIELQNAATTLRAVELLSDQLPIARSLLDTALRKVFLPGRFQIIENQKIMTILDVAHNPAAGELLAKKLRMVSISGRILAVVAMLADKDAHGTVAPLIQQVSTWYVAGLDVSRGGASQLLAVQLQLLGAKTVHEHTRVRDGYEHALRDAQPGDCIVVFGSFYTVAEVLHQVV